MPGPAATTRPWPPGSCPWPRSWSRRPTCRPASGCWTWPVATATPPRARAAAEGPGVEFAEGDAEDLRFPDGAFDAVLSVVGGDVHPRPGAGRGRAGPGVPAGRDDRGGQLDPDQLRRADLPHRDQVRSRPGGGQAAGPVGPRGGAGGAARPGGVAPRDHPTAVRVPVPLPGPVRGLLPDDLRPGP